VFQNTVKERSPGPLVQSISDASQRRTIVVLTSAGNPRDRSRTQLDSLTDYSLSVAAVSQSARVCNNGQPKCPGAKKHLK
jgi:hypothetical protein